jgi:hypothetical protein
MSNSNASSKETSATAALTDGGIEYYLRRVVAERATSSRHAVEVIIDMLEKYGYAPSGRAYSVGDKKEIWQVQIVMGNKYVAVRLPDDHVMVMSNHYTVKHPDVYLPTGPYGDKGADVIYPGSGYGGRPKLNPASHDHLIGYAMDQGWYTPAVSGDYSDFDFARAYQATGSYKANTNTIRHAFAENILAGTSAPLPTAYSGTDYNTWVNGREFYSTYKVTGKVPMNTLRKAISCHYEGTPLDGTRYTPGDEPHGGGERRICTGTTIQSAMVQFHEDPKLTTLWTAFGRSCALPSIPLHPVMVQIPDIVTLSDPADTLSKHLIVEPDRGLHVENKWQKFREFLYMMEMTYKDHIGDRAAQNGEVAALLAEYFNEAQVANANLLNEAAPYAAAVEKFDQEWLDKALTRLQDYIASKPLLGIPVYTDTYFDRSNAMQTTLDIIFEMPAGKTPTSPDLRMRVGAVSASYQTPTNLTHMGGNKWKCTISRANLTSWIANGLAPGEYDFFIGGRTTSNEAFTGMVYIHFSDGIAAHKVEFVDWDGTVLRTRFIENGKPAVPPQDPKQPGYKFTGWDKDFSNITANLVVTAKYELAVGPFTVKFVDWDGTVLSEQTINAGDPAVAPTSPARLGYKFIGWDKNFSNVTSDLTVVAQYEKIGKSGGGGGCNMTFGFLALALMGVITLVFRKR